MGARIPIRGANRLFGAAEGLTASPAWRVVEKGSGGRRSGSYAPSIGDAHSKGALLYRCNDNQLRARMPEIS